MTEHATIRTEKAAERDLHFELSRLAASFPKAASIDLKPSRTMLVTERVSIELEKENQK